MAVRIDGLVTAVGSKYISYLSKSIPIWVNTLDSLTVVTDYQEVPFSLYHDSGAKFHCTDAFTRYGAHFNKGLALAEAFGVLNPTSYVLNFDADILPEKNWRKKVEPLLQVGRLHGCSRRYREDGTVIPDSNFPDLWGFFHLWHIDDPHTWVRPVYPVDCGHAGNYDHTFQKRWEPENKIDLPIHLIHQGEPRSAWFGTDNPKNEKYMNNLHNLGLYEAWLTKAGHIKVPEFKNEIVIDRIDLLHGISNMHCVMRNYTDPDPFKYHVVVK